MNQLKHELPNIQNFVTLSPIPGFRKWLDFKLVESSESAIIHNIMGKLKFINSTKIDADGMSPFRGE